MKIGVVQSSPIFGDKEKNLLKIADVAQYYSSADLLVYTELATTGYMFKDRQEALEYAEEIPTGKTTNQLVKLAKSVSTYLVVGMPEKVISEDGVKIYISTVLLGPNGYIGKYQKTHLFFNEKDIFSPGDAISDVFDVGKAKLGIGICYDHMFPEYWRHMALSGAQIFAHPSNLVLPWGQKNMRTRALENGVFAITANRVGTERGLTFSGKSQIVSPKMDILATTSSHKEEVAIVDINIQDADDKNVSEKNNIFDERRVDLY